MKKKITLAIAAVLAADKVAVRQFLGLEYIDFSSADCTFLSHVFSSFSCFYRARCPRFVLLLV